MSDRILLAHGSGGQLSRDLVEQVFLRYFDNPILARLDDAAILEGSERQEAGGRKQEAGSKSHVACRRSQGTGRSLTGMRAG